MKFNDATNNSGICQQVWFLTGTDSTSFPTSDIARICNSQLRELALLAWRVSSLWDFDDKNHTTLNIAEVNLVDGQSDYELASTDFDLERVEIIDVNNLSRKIIPIDEKEIIGSIDEFMKTKGVPEFYFLRGNAIFLKPAPDTSLVSKLKIYISRDINEFTASDTTKEPGLPTVLHPIVPIKTALEYAGVHNLPQLSYIKNQSDKWDSIFLDYFTFRGEKKVRISPRVTNFE